MTLDATFWVMISFFLFIGLLIYFHVPQKVKSALEENISNIKNQIEEANKLKEDAKNILIEHEKKISNSKNEVKSMISKAAEEAERVFEEVSEEVHRRKPPPLEVRLAGEKGTSVKIKWKINYFLN